MNNIKNCFETVDDLAEKYLSFTKTICEISSKSEDKAGVDAVLDTILEHEKNNNYKIVRRKMEKAGDVASLTYFCGDGVPTISLSGHMDTVFPKGTFKEPMVTEDDENMYGPGVCDDKGGVAIALLVMKALKQTGFDKANIKVILQSDEEVNSVLSDKKTIDFMCEEAKDSIAFFNLEPGGEDYVINERCGILKYQFDVYGKAAHAAEKMQGQGINAIKEASYKIIEIENVPSSENLSFVVGLINGGTAPNTVAEHCSFTVDCRIKTLADKDKADEFMRAVADKQYVSGTTCKLTLMGPRIPFEKNEKTEELFEKINSANIKYFGTELRKMFRGGGADAAYTAAAGIPSADGLGIYGGNIHSTGEFMVKSSMAKCAKRIIAAIYELLDL